MSLRWRVQKYKGYRYPRNTVEFIQNGQQDHPLASVVPGPTGSMHYRYLQVLDRILLAVVSMLLLSCINAKFFDDTFQPILKLDFRKEPAKTDKPVVLRLSPTWCSIRICPKSEWCESYFSKLNAMTDFFVKE